MNVHREPRHALGLSLLSVAFLIGAASPAAAHDGEGILTVESQIPTGDVVVEYVVRVTWADDGHPALQSTVTATRSEEHTSELQSLMPISYAVFSLTQKKHSYA